MALSSGGAVEAGALGESFGALLLLRWRLVVQQGDPYPQPQPQPQPATPTPTPTPTPTLTSTRTPTPTRNPTPTPTPNPNPNHTGLLNAATFFFEYLGGVVNYAAVGIALCAGTYDERPTEEQVAHHLPASPCISLHLPASPCISL